jgi:hypothetical protein
MRRRLALQHAADRCQESKTRLEDSAAVCRDTRSSQCSTADDLDEIRSPTCQNDEPLSALRVSRPASTTLKIVDDSSCVENILTERFEEALYDL